MVPRPPIPTPWRRRLTLFCAEKLPFVMFGLGVLAAAGLWIQSTAPTLVAEADSVTAEVRSTQSGTLTSLDVSLLEPVRTGQIIGRLRLADPRVLAASLGALQAEIDFMRTSLDPVIPAQRVALDACRLQLDWMHERVTRASLRVRLQQAEADLQRVTPLREKNVVSEEVYDTARHQRENMAAQLAEQEKLVEALTSVAGNLASHHPKLAAHSASGTLAAAVFVREEKLRLADVQLGETALVAPIDGVVSAVHRRAGETVTAGEPVVVVTSVQPARIVSFLRQPILTSPRAGMQVELRTRNAARQVATAQITEVGWVMEPVSPRILAVINRASSPELGLRVHIALPPGFPLRPGEQVDVTIKH